jgi:mRNA interferase RelE/StbE
MFKIVLTKRVLKDIEKIDIKTKTYIGNKLKTLSDDPIGVSKKLSNPVIGTYRFRIGDYRVIFDLEKDEVIVLRIGHRRDIYK